jgi:hypothetical protein
MNFVKTWECILCFKYLLRKYLSRKKIIFMEMLNCTQKRIIVSSYGRQRKGDSLIAVINQNVIHCHCVVFK